MNRMKTTFVALACLLGSACGFSSGLDPETEGKDLSEKETKAFCEAQRDYMEGVLSEEDAKNFACHLGAMIATALSGGDKAMCEEKVEECLDEEPEEAEETECPDVVDEDCEATVAEMEACVEERAEAIKKLAEEITCDDVGDEPDEDANEPGPACKKVIDNGC